MGCNASTSNYCTCTVTISLCMLTLCMHVLERGREHDCVHHYAKITVVCVCVCSFMSNGRSLEVI